MNIGIYILCFNEAKILKYTIEHYLKKNKIRYDRSTDQRAKKMSFHYTDKIEKIQI